MTTQRRPAPAGGDPKRRVPTTRRSLGTARALASRKTTNNLLVGGALAGAAFIGLLVLLLSGGDEPSDPGPVRRSAGPAQSKAAGPDVSALEEQGRDKCERGSRMVEPRLARDPSAHRENARRDLESGIALLREGLAAFRKAGTLSGKHYTLSDYERMRDRALKVFCEDVEKEADDSCAQGLKLIQATERMMTSKGTLAEGDKRMLKAELEKGKKLIEDGMNLFDRAHQVSENRYDTNRYGQALKMARAKLLELR